MLSELLAHVEFKLVNFTDFNDKKLTLHFWVFQKYVAYSELYRDLWWNISTMMRAMKGIILQIMKKLLIFG